jgi:hypothetical protein
MSPAVFDRFSIVIFAFTGAMLVCSGWSEVAPKAPKLDG